jgi:hypothetical protein
MQVIHTQMRNGVISTLAHYPGKEFPFRIVSSAGIEYFDSWHEASQQFYMED